MQTVIRLSFEGHPP